MATEVRPEDKGGIVDRAQTVQRALSGRRPAPAPGAPCPQPRTCSIGVEGRAHLRLRQRPAPDLGAGGESPGHHAAGLRPERRDIFDEDAVNFTTINDIPEVSPNPRWRRPQRFRPADHGLCSAITTTRGPPRLRSTTSRASARRAYRLRPRLQRDHEPAGRMNSSDLFAGGLTVREGRVFQLKYHGSHQARLRHRDLAHLRLEEAFWGLPIEKTPADLTPSTRATSPGFHHGRPGEVQLRRAQAATTPARTRRPTVGDRPLLGLEPKVGACA